MARRDNKTGKPASDKAAKRDAKPEPRKTQSPPDPQDDPYEAGDIATPRRDPPYEDGI